MLHLFVIGGQRHRHRVNAVFQNAEFSQHVALNAAVELAATDAVNGGDHIADRAGNIAHQAISKQHGKTEAEEQHQRGNKHLFVLLQAHRLQIQFNRHIAQRIARGLGIFIR